MNDVSTVFTGDGIHAVLTIDSGLGRLEFSIHGCTDPVPDATELEVLLLRRTAEGWLGGVVECLFSRRIALQYTPHANVCTGRCWLPVNLTPTLLRTCYFRLRLHK
jgi:hypothetical protein